LFASLIAPSSSEEPGGRERLQSRRPTALEHEVRGDDRVGIAADDEELDVGGAVAVDDEEMIRLTCEVGSSEGLFVSPEGAACFAALKSLCRAGKIASSERVVIFNTGSGIKYLDSYEP